MKRMVEDLTTLWGNFTLLEEESDVAEVKVDEFTDIAFKGKSFLVGKLMSKRSVEKDRIRSTLIKGWRPTGSLAFKVLGRNTFLLDFEYMWDKERVMEGRLWVFEGSLFSVVEFDGSTPPTQLPFHRAAFWVRMYHTPLACMGKKMFWVTMFCFNCGIICHGDLGCLKRSIRRNQGGEQKLEYGPWL